MSRLDSFFDAIPPTRDTDYAYRMGLDCGRNGPNTTNCHFSLFGRPEMTAAWERGKREAETEVVK